MRNMRCRQEPKPVPPDFQDLVVIERPRRPISKVADSDHSANHAANGLSVRCNRKEIIQSSALVRFKMAKTDPAQLLRIDETRHAIQRDWKHLLESGVHDEWLIVLDKKLIELDTVFRMKRRDSINVRRDFNSLVLH